MATNRLEIVKLAKDMICNKVPANFSDASKNSEALVEKLVEINGGSSKISLKQFVRGNELFEIMEEIIPTIIHKGLEDNYLVKNLCDYKNIALGDDIDFWTENETELVVSDSSYGAGIHRQRLGKKTKVNIPTSLKTVKVYDELARLLANRFDFTEFSTAVVKAMTKELINTIITTLEGVTSSTTGINSTYVKTGSFVEADLTTLIQHVKADSDNSEVMILGTATGLAKITTAVTGDNTQADIYNLGYYGKFHGVPMIEMPQLHKTNTDTFVLNDNKIYIIGVNDKPVKVINVGEGILDTKNPFETADGTVSVAYGQEFGVGMLFNQKMGFWTFS